MTTEEYRELAPWVVTGTYEGTKLYSSRWERSENPRLITEDEYKKHAEVHRQDEVIRVVTDLIRAGHRIKWEMVVPADQAEAIVSGITSKSEHFKRAFKGVDD